MAYIKTRDVVKKTIKIMDKGITNSKRIKTAYLKTKDSAKQGYYSDVSSANEYSADKITEAVEHIKSEILYQFNVTGRKTATITKNNIDNVKSDFNKRQFIKAIKQRKNIGLNRTLDLLHKRVNQPEKRLKTVIKTAPQNIKTSKVAVKTTENTTKTVQEMSRLAAQRVMQKARTTVKKASGVTTTAIKAAIMGIKGLITAIIAGGWAAIMVIIIICFIGLIANSSFGIFFSGEDIGNGMTMRTAIKEINAEYYDKIDEIKKKVNYDVLDMSGNRAMWKEVLSVYSVKIITDPDNPQDVVVMDSRKKQILENIFWEMNEVNYRTDSKTEDNEQRTYLHINISHKGVREMAERYKFNNEQKEMLSELLIEENNGLWSRLLYSVSLNGDEIVTVALSQVGNVGGEPYWSWYGFDEHVDWCACFVSWCLNECGIKEPKFSLCDDGVQWFKNNGTWYEKGIEPEEGMIIFFDWNNDGSSDHVGIVKTVDNGLVKTIEGNSNDECKEKAYTVGSELILGYGVV